MNFHTQQRGWASVCLEIYNNPCTRNDNTSLSTCFTPNRLINSQSDKRNESDQTVDALRSTPFDWFHNLTWLQHDLFPTIRGSDTAHKSLSISSFLYIRVENEQTSLSRLQMRDWMQNILVNSPKKSPDFCAELDVILTFHSFHVVAPSLTLKSATILKLKQNVCTLVFTQTPSKTSASVSSV